MRTKNAIRIITSSLILQLIIVISGLILPKLIIETYGSALNGLVSTIKQILTYFSIVSLGLGAASQVALYKPLAENDIKKINGILAATSIFFKRTGYIFASLVGATVLIFPLVVRNDVNIFTTGAIILISGIGSICEYIIVSKYRILLIADQKNHVVSSITTQGVIINLVVSVALIYLNSSIVVIQLVATSVYVLRLLLTKKYVQKHYPQVNFKAIPDFNAISKRGDALSYQLPGMIITYTPIIMIVIFLGLNNASIYSVYNMVYSSLGMIVAVFSAGLAPSFGNVMASNDLDVLRKSTKTFEFIFRNISFFCYSCALILIVPFISIYINNNDNVNYVIPSVGILFALSGLFKSIRTPSATLVEAAGKFKENKVSNIIEAIANIVISLILIIPFGLNGILISAAITAFMRSIIYVVYMYKHILKINVQKSLGKIFVNCILMLVLYYVPFNLQCTNFIEWFFVAIRVSSITFIAFILINTLIDPEAARDVIKRVKGLWGKSS